MLSVPRTMPSRATMRGCGGSSTGGLSSETVGWFIIVVEDAMSLVAASKSDVALAIACVSEIDVGVGVGRVASTGVGVGVVPVMAVSAGPCFKYCAAMNAY